MAAFSYMNVTIGLTWYNTESTGLRGEQQPARTGCLQYHGTRW
jgi:uncharacterized ubiquitin-like protein YukD